MEVTVLMQYFVMANASKHNCQVMLDGQGADEALLGYERYFPAFFMSLNPLRAISEFFAATKNSKLSFFDLVAFCLYFTVSRVRLARLKRRCHFVKQDAMKHLDREFIAQAAKSYLNLSELQKFELTRTQLRHLLRYEDKNSMRFSIETRLPFLDYRLVEYCLRLPPITKIKNGWTKYVLRKVMHKLIPSEVIWRREKFGFEAPTSQLLNSLQTQMSQEISKSELIKKLTNEFDFSQVGPTIQWRLFNIAK